MRVQKMQVLRGNLITRKQETGKALGFITRNLAGFHKKASLN